ncbi:TetR/AcrR family transcriptional regulator [Proteus mirabilis]
MKLKSRQQENSEQTRLALLEAGQYLFVNQCYYDVSIDEISRYARVTKGAFYHHFSNKKALLRECYLLQVKHAVQKLDEVPTYDDKWQELTALFSLCVDHIYQCKNELIPLQEVISVLGWGKSGKRLTPTFLFLVSNTVLIFSLLKNRSVLIHQLLW